MRGRTKPKTHKPSAQFVLSSRLNEMQNVEVDVHEQASHVVAVAVEGDELDVDVATVEVVIVSQHAGASRRKRKQRMTHMSAQEALAQAAREGLVFVKSATAVTGYHGVVFDKRNAYANVPYAVYAPGGKSQGHFLGCFATVEEAALTFARHTCNTVEQTIHARPGAKAKMGQTEAQSYLAVCRNPSCGSLVHMMTANRQARANGRESSYEAGDGCSGPLCTDRSYCNLKRFKETQVKMANDLLKGERQLIAWPSAPGPAASRSFNKIASGLILSAAVTREKAEDILANHALPE
jgi:hypothetical protein